MFCLQCETLGLSPSSVILSVGLFYFDEDDPDTFNTDPEKTLYVKFSAKDQLKKYNRTYEKSTGLWWKTQSHIVQEYSLLETKRDVSVELGILLLKNHVAKYSKSNQEIVWTRGYIHSTCLDSLFKSAQSPPLFKHYQYRDIRTAIDMTKDTADNGFCKVPNHQINIDDRHIPHYNVVQDAEMLLFGV